MTNDLDIIGDLPARKLSSEMLPSYFYQNIQLYIQSYRYSMSDHQTSYMLYIMAEIPTYMNRRTALEICV